MTLASPNRDYVISGGTGALGQALVAQLVAEGATCHLPHFGDQAPKGELFESSQVHLSLGVDFTDEAQVIEYFADKEIWGLANIAGGFSMQPFVEASLNDFEGMFRLNALTCFLSMREGCKAIKRQGHGGRVVNVAARPVVSPVGGMVSYAASKAMVASLTQSVAAELLGEDILVNAVMPSIIDTPANRSAMPDAEFKDWPKPAELAQVMAFLLSPENKVTSGSLVPVYGRG